jgi:hypothetical protein
MWSAGGKKGGHILIMMDAFWCRYRWHMRLVPTPESPNVNNLLERSRIMSGVKSTVQMYKDAPVTRAFASSCKAK